MVTLAIHHRCRKSKVNMASLEKKENYSNNPAVEITPKRAESREGSAERKVEPSEQRQAHAASSASASATPAAAMPMEQQPSNDANGAASLRWLAQVGGEVDASPQASKDREEKLKYARDRQNEERQRKIEELRAQAEAAQKYREQKEEERRRRIDEIRVRDTEKRHQVEERKKAIIEAEKERREYILKKNQERESKIETKRRDRNSIGFAFGSSTPRLLDVPGDYGQAVSPSTFWGQRRSTSISNVAGASSLSRRSSERELVDSGAKKLRASSSTDRHDDHRRKSSSMYEVFNWGYSNDEPPKRFSLSIAGSEINIDGPPPPHPATQGQSRHAQTNQITPVHRQYTTTTTTTATNAGHNYNNNNYQSTRKEDFVDTSPIVFRSVYRRKTDLMPTIPSPRDGHYYGSRSSLSTTPRTPGRAYSMNRLDQLAQPIRRNGEHVRAILERERRDRELEMLDETASLGGGRRGGASTGVINRSKRAGSAGVSSGVSSGSASVISRSMTHLAAGGGHGQGQRGGKYSLGGGISSNFRPLGSNGQRDSSSRSGNVTPGGHLSGSSRPGSAMSNSTTMSTSNNFVQRRPATAAPRKPRPASIAGTGMSLEEINKLKKEQRPPVKTSSSAASPSSTAQTTPKRTPNLMSTSLIVTSSSSRLSSAEKKTPAKQQQQPLPPKAASASKALPSRTVSSERISRLSSKEPKGKDNSAMAKSMIVSSTATEENGLAIVKKREVREAEKTAAEAPAQSKAEKEALNSVKTEEATVETEPAAELAAKPEPEPTAVEEKVDEGNEKEEQQSTQQQPTAAAAAAVEIIRANNGEKKSSSSSSSSRNGSKENSEVRELTPPTLLANAEGNDLMTASMIAKKITTEEEAKAALAERRRLAREEAERQAELERQRLEAERLAEIKQQEEEAERQRLFEEESTRMAEQQRRGEEERLRIAIEEATQREQEEQRKREEEERQRLEREEAEKKAKEEAEKQRVEVAERLKREEKEREERRKRVEAIMSRTRKAGAAATPSKESNDGGKPTPENAAAPASKEEASSESGESGGSSSNSSGSPSAPSATATTGSSEEQPNTQAIYEQSVLDKENSLINSFSSMIIDENAKNLQPFEVSNGKMHVEFNSSTTTAAVANGNGHIENVNNKNDINLLQDLQDAVTPATTQLIDLSIESQDLHNNPLNLNLNNNNSLLTTTTTTTTNTLVTADSHENKDISLL